MIIGIDFGTTFTVIALYENNELKFFDWKTLSSKNHDSNNQNIFLETKINNIENLKRLIAENAATENFETSEIFKATKDFFANIHNQLKTENIQDCVLTVPARFDDFARNAIKAAAISAGFNVLKLLTEPIAAAIYNIKNKKNGYYLVYDLGGGTFDATLLNFQNEVFQILSIDGLKNFGGIDIDQIIAKQKNLNLENARIFKEKNITFEKELENKINHELQKTYDIIFKLLKEKNINKEQINQLILTGGSSRISMIFEELSKNFYIEKTEPIDLMVAAGAAKFGNMIISNQGLLIDALPFNLALETIEGKEIILAKNSPLPISKSMFFKRVPNSSVLINILQGDGDEYISLTKFALTESEFQDAFQVSFMIDFDGIFSIKIGSKTIILSALKYQKPKNNNSLIQEINEQVAEYKKQNNFNNEQEKFYQYIKQAIDINCSKDAEKWLFEQFKKLFQ